MPETMESLILEDEGLRIWPYVDTAGNKTWGVGHNLNASPVDPTVETLLRTAAMTQMRLDLAQVVTAAAAETWWPTLGDPRQAAIADMLFNLGTGALYAFVTFFGMIAAGNFSAAATDLRSTKVYSELPVRYERIAQMIETGAWPTS